MKIFGLIISIFFSSFLFSQDSTFVKYTYAGNQIIISQEQNWILKKVFISEGNSYNIQINNNIFQETYTSGDTLKVPYYIAEMELLTNKSLVQFQFHFNIDK